MKGLHNTIDGWKYDRDVDGWKLQGKPFQAMLVEKYQMAGLCQQEHNEEEGGAFRQWRVVPTHQRMNQRGFD